MIRLLIADGDPLVRRSLRQLLSDGVRLAVVGEAGSGDEAVSKARWLRPDVVLLDARLEGRSAPEACAAITAAMPGTRVLVLGFYDHAELRRQSLAAGAAAYLVKDLDLTALREALLAPPASAAPQPA